MNKTNQESEDQRLLAEETMQVIKNTQSLKEKLAGKENVPRFEVQDTEIRGRPVFLVDAGKNCFFEVDKGVLEKLQEGILSDVRNSVGEMVSKADIIGHLRLSISCARSNIDQMLRYVE